MILVGDRDTHVAGTGVHRDQSGYFWQAPAETTWILLDWTARH